MQPSEISLIRFFLLLPTAFSIVTSNVFFTVVVPGLAKEISTSQRAETSISSPRLLRNIKEAATTSMNQATKNYHDEISSLKLKRDHNFIVINDNGLLKVRKFNPLLKEYIDERLTKRMVNSRDRKFAWNFDGIIEDGRVRNTDVLSQLKVDLQNKFVDSSESFVKDSENFEIHENLEPQIKQPLTQSKLFVRKQSSMENIKEISGIKKKRSTTEFEINNDDQKKNFWIPIGTDIWGSFSQPTVYYGYGMPIMFVQWPSNTESKKDRGYYDKDKKSPMIARNHRPEKIPKRPKPPKDHTNCKTDENQHVDTGVDEQEYSNHQVGTDYPDCHTKSDGEKDETMKRIGGKMKINSKNSRSNQKLKIIGKPRSLVTPKPKTVSRMASSSRANAPLKHYLKHIYPPWPEDKKILKNKS